MEKKSYYAVIPADVRYAAIPNGAKLLYGEITSLCNEQGYCWASNSYFESLYGVTKVTIIRWLNILEEEGFISKELQYKDDSKEVDRRIITLTPVSKMIPPSDKNDTTPGIKNDTDNIKDINNKKSIAKAIPEKEVKTSFDELAKEAKKKAEEDKIKFIVNEFNRVCTKLPKALKITPQRAAKIKARLKTFDETEIYKAFELANCSKFLTGSNSNGWKATFDWFFENDSNIQKVLEGNYDNNEKPQDKPKVNTFLKFEHKHNYDLKALEKKLLGDSG